MISLLTDGVFILLPLPCLIGGEFVYIGYMLTRGLERHESDHEGFGGEGKEERMMILTLTSLPTLSFASLTICSAVICMGAGARFFTCLDVDW